MRGLFRAPFHFYKSMKNVSKYRIPILIFLIINGESFHQRLFPCYNLHTFFNAAIKSASK